MNIISNPQKFWEIAQAIKLPTGLKIHSTLSHSEGTKVVYLSFYPTIK
ncbi:MAG: hypothetical protein P4L35_17070 [Ignavibacteriaceae bacterium]|nr:hypothetical protein [Ignavibacteriaceae bacterium]